MVVTRLSAVCPHVETDHCEWRAVAIDETVILLIPPSPSLLKHLLKGEGVQQNDSTLVNG